MNHAPLRGPARLSAEDGLHRLALGGGVLDSGYSMDALAKLYDAAMKLGMDAAKAFAEAARIAPEGALKQR